MGCFQSSHFRRGRRREEDENHHESSQAESSRPEFSGQILNFDSDFKNITNEGNRRDEWSQKGIRLQRVSFKWRTSSKLSSEELKHKQGIFWETCYTYGGQKQVWDALKSICNDKDMSLELSGAILESCGVIIPYGQLTEIYDETGFRYNLPPYCVCDPVDLLENISEDAVDPEDIKGNLSKVIKLRLSNEIKKYVTESEDLEDRRIVIIWRGQVLTDEMKLTSLNLPKDAILQAMIP